MNRMEAKAKTKTPNLAFHPVNPVHPVQMHREKTAHPLQSIAKQQ
jgi:hypothetical protein